MSKTDQFKEHIQSIVLKETGAKISKDKAWNLFKNIFKGTVQFTCKQDDKTLSLAGVAKFAVKESNTPKGKVSRIKIYPSSAIKNAVRVLFGEKVVDSKGKDVKVEPLGNYGIYDTSAPKAEVKSETAKKEI